MKRVNMHRRAATYVDKILKGAAALGIIDINAEAAEAWSGPLFDRFVRYRELVADGLGARGRGLAGMQLGLTPAGRL